MVATSSHRLRVCLGHLLTALGGAVEASARAVIDLRRQIYPDHARSAALRR